MQQSKARNKILTVSNLLTTSRFIITPCIVVALHSNKWGLALLLLSVAGISDLLDGFIARLLNEPTWLGSVLDPIADKMLVVCTLVAFLFYSSNTLLPGWFVLLIAIREAVLLVGGTLLYLIRPSFVVQPSWLGKITTFLILSLMGLVLLRATYELNITLLINTTMYFCLASATISFIEYIRRGMSYLQ